MTAPTSPRTNVVQRWWHRVRPGPGELGREAVAGIPGAIGSVPDGMASAVLAGVNPVFGLYASFAGPVAGGLSASTRLMVITTTTASALAAGSVLATVDEADRPASLFLMVIMGGALMVLAGMLKLGRFTRFVSHSVMIGFLTGVAANIVFGQLPDLTGVAAEGANSPTHRSWPWPSPPSSSSASTGWPGWRTSARSPAVCHFLHCPRSG